MPRLTDRFIQPGDVLTVTAPYDLTPGDGAAVGGLFGVAAGDADNGAPVELITEGVFALDKTSAQAWAQGDRVFWNAGTKKADNDPTTGMLIGVAVAAADNPSSTGQVKLTPIAPLLEGAQATIAAVVAANADGTYGAEEATLINELKTKLDSVIAALKAVGIVASA